MNPAEAPIIAALRMIADQLGGYAAASESIESTDAQLALGVQRLAARLADIGERVGDPADNLDRFIAARESIVNGLLDGPGGGIQLAETLASIISELAAADADPRPAAIRAAGGGDMARVVSRLRGYAKTLRSVTCGIAPLHVLDASARRMVQGAVAMARARNPEYFCMRDLQREIRDMRWHMNNPTARAVV